MKILLVAYAYPPYPIVGSIRAQRLADAFLGAGHQVHVLTARLPQDKSRIRYSAERLTVETVSTWPHPKDFYRWLKHRVAGSRSAESEGAPRSTGEERWQPPTDAPAWKRYVLSLLHVPDDLQGFIVPAVWRGLRAFPGGPDLIYTTSPPNSAHLATLCLKVLTRSRWVAEFRDPWVGNAAKLEGNPMRSRPADAVDRWLERRCLRSADRVVTVTDTAAAMVAGRMPEGAPPPVVVRNGIARRLEPPGRSGAQPFRILYVGGIDAGRDPVPFLNAAAALVSASGGGEASLRIDFVGNCRYYGDLDLQELARTLGLQDIVFFPGRVSHDEALRLQREADLLLLLAQKQPAQVPNKLYEYLGANRPILALVDHAGESARMLRRVGGHYLVTERNDWDVGPALRDAFGAFANGSRFRGDGPSAEVLEEWTVDRQMRHLLQEVGIV